MGVPLKRPAEGVEDTDETRDKVSTFIYRVKHSENDTANSQEKTIQQVTVFEEEVSEIFINGKNTVSVGATDELKGHFS